MIVNPSPCIRTRAARLEDAGEIARMGAHTFSVTFGHSVQPHQLQKFLEESYSVEATAKDIADPNKDMIVATTEADDIVGFALLTRNSSEPCVEHLESKVELQRLYVHPDSHGGGVGKLLAHALELMAREQGFEHMWLGVWEENHKAQKVYEKLGYKGVGEHDFDVGGDIQTDLIMFKRL